MLYSTIKLYETVGGWSVKIDHSGRTAKSGFHANAADAYSDAYSDAESKLIYKPGYVQVVPKEER